VSLFSEQPILEHVVFCHQEDSSWPLQEGAVLKKRFDDIFDSTRYSKALEVFAKQKKEFVAKVKDLKTDLSGLASHRHAARGFQSECQKYSEQVEELEEEISDTKKQLEDISVEQEHLTKIIAKLDDLNLAIESRKNELRQERAVVKKQRTLLQEDLTKTQNVRELKEMLRDFDQAMGKQVERKEELEADIGHRKADLDKLSQDEKDLQATLGRLQGQKENQEKRLRLRFERMTELGQRYGLENVLSQISQTQGSQTQNASFASTLGDNSFLGGGGTQETILEIAAEDMEEFYRALAKKEEELKENLAEHREKHQKQEDQLQTVLSDHLGKQKSIENDRAKLKKEETDSRKELAQINSQVSTTSRFRKSDVEEAKRNAARLADERDVANSDPRRTEIPTEIRSLEEKIDKFKREIDDDQIALNDLRHSAEAQNAIAVLREQSTKELEMLQGKKFYV
jgi:DNA repair protein RAD50